MKKFDKLLKGHKYICFMDFEGTQFSHEMIAIGAVMATLDRKGRVKAKKSPFKLYVKAHNKIGSYVSELTGINEKLLKEKGTTFYDAMIAFKKYCGIAFAKCSFCTFGNHDMRILSQSIAYNFDFPKEVVQQIQKNYIDYSTFLSEFVKDEKGNPLSLVHYCELFDVKTVGPNHDPSVDAVNLCLLHDAMIKNNGLIHSEYKKVLTKFAHIPDPIKHLVNKLYNNESVSPNDFDEEIRKYIA